MIFFFLTFFFILLYIVVKSGRKWRKKFAILLRKILLHS